MLARAKQIMTPFWLVSWALTLAAGWLLPNHQFPWPSFHLDAWVASALALGSAAVILRSRGQVRWHGITLAVAAVALVPGLQYGLGIVLLPGTAWISSAYLLGLLLAVHTGARWEASSPGQLADGLFLAIGTGALLSVSLQSHQWLNLQVLDSWSMADGLGRPFANFGQPNQLATFLLWGLLATGWALLRRHIAGKTALLIAHYLLFGLALTESRTAWIAITILISAIWYWRALWPDSRWPWMVTWLGLYFIVCASSIGWLSQVLHLGGHPVTSDAGRVAAELRPLIWSVFIDAALQHPLLGYGWNQVGLAQLTAALAHPSLELLHTHSHNLFLDLVLWCGIPLGLFLSLYLMRWLWHKLRAVKCAEDAILMLFLLLIANHSMLELPLHYAYFLLPVGLVIGVTSVRLQDAPVLYTGRWSLLLIWLTSSTLLLMIVREYLRVETSYQELRMEQAHIRIDAPGAPPDVMLLTQFHEFIRLSRVQPSSGMSVEKLDWMSQVARTFPGTATIPKLALALGLNHRQAEASQWLKKVCKIEPESRCEAVRQYWEGETLKHPELIQVPWPNSASVATSR
jgi:O-antigen ligase